MNLRFQRVATKPNSFTAGTVYFEDASNLIYVGTGSGANDYVVYSGVRDVNWNSTTAELSFVKPNGSTITLDFDNLVGYDDFDILVSGIGLQKIKEQDDSSSYRFSATGITGTDFLSTADSSTVIGALRVLDSQLKTVSTNAGVISLGGAQGVLSLKGDNTSTGSINLTMNTSTLTASIVDSSSAAYKTVEYFIGIDGSTDNSTNNTIKGAKAYTAEVLGDDSDASTATTVYGAISKAQAVKTELLGDSTNDTSASKTIEGLTKKIDAINTDNTLHLYSGTTGTTAATNVTADGQTYRLVQGSDATNVIAIFNIEKDSFVQDGSVVYFSTDASAQAGTGNASATAGHYIHLVIKTSDATSGTSSEKDIWIPAESLVDTYSADNTGNNVTVSVDNTNNKISAQVAVSDGTHLIQHNNTLVTLATIAGQTIQAKLASIESVAANTAGGVQLTETTADGSAKLSASLIDNAVTTNKILDANVTEAKLSADVSTKLNGAIQTVTGETAISNPSDEYIDVKVSATKSGTDVSLSTTCSLTTQDVSTANTNTDGLATAYDVQTYVSTYVAEQLTWSAWPS